MGSTKEKVKLNDELLHHVAAVQLISFHPETEKFYSDQVQAAAKILYNTVTKHYHLFSQERINEATAEAVGMFSEDEQGWLQENLPDLISVIDAAMADYPEFGEIKNERATSTIGWNSEYDHTELADEDWARVRAALEAAKKEHPGCIAVKLLHFAALQSGDFTLLYYYAKPQIIVRDMPRK